MKGTCKICGCTEKNACNHPEFGTCWWINDSQDLCSHCVELKDDPAVVRPSKITPESFIGIRVQCCSDNRKGETIETDLKNNRVRVKWDKGPRTWMRMSNLKPC